MFIGIGQELGEYAKNRLFNDGFELNAILELNAEPDGMLKTFDLGEYHDWQIQNEKAQEMLFEQYMNIMDHICPICGRPHGAREVEEIHGNEETVEICRECARERFIRCSSCGDYFLPESVTPIGNGEYACDLCLDERYTTCSDCGILVHEDDARSSDDDGRTLCESCYQTEQEQAQESDDYDSYEEEPGIISHYGQPSGGWQKIGTGWLYGGFELEVDEPRNSDDYDKHGAANEIARKYSGKLVNKSDGSLNDGFEIVTNPHTPEEYEKLDIEDICKIARANGMRSHDTTTAGFHVHINKDAFSHNGADYDDSVANVIMIFERNFRQILKLSRRTEQALANWAARYVGRRFYDDEGKECVLQEPMEKENSKKVVKENGFGNRYHAINLTNSNTVEFRFWRGSLNPETVRGMLDITFGIVKAAISGEDGTSGMKSIVDTYCGKNGKKYWNVRFPDDLIEMEEKSADPVDDEE
jgi:ribosomal protein L32